MRALRLAFHAPDTRAHHVVEDTVVVAVLLSIGLFIADTAFTFTGSTALWVNRVDQFFLWFFVVEITLRILSYRPKELDFFHRKPWKQLKAHVLGRLKFAVTPLMIVDLMAVLAVYPALRGLRALRLLRLIRGFHLFRYRNPFEGIAQAFRDNRILYVFTFSALGTCVLVGGLCMYFVERGNNPGVARVADGLWWALVTITTVGFGDITPQTGLGQAVGSVLMVAGLFMLAMFAGVVGNTLLNAVLTLREEQFRMSGYFDHIVVCGYDQGSRMLLDMLLEERVDEGRQLVVFGPGSRPDNLRTEYIWVSGDPTKESELDKARISLAAAVIVIGSRIESSQRADALTILTVFTLRRYLKNRGDAERARPLYIVCEILDSENVEHAQSAGADEVIETTRFGFSLISHAINQPGTATTMGLMATRDAQSLFIGTLNHGTTRNNFSTASQLLKEQHSALLIGIRRPDGEEEINPDGSTELGPYDQLIYLADEPVLPP